VKQATSTPVRDSSKDGWRGREKKERRKGTKTKRWITEVETPDGKADKMGTLAVSFGPGPEGIDVG
jgi:hypothetical protein